MAMVEFKLQDYVLTNCFVAFILSSITKYHRLGGSNNKPLFLTVPESGKAEIKASVGQCLMRACFLRWQPSHVASHDGTQRRSNLFLLRF